MGGNAALKEVRALLAPERPAEMRHLALGILAKVRPGDAVGEAQKMLESVQTSAEALPVWRALTSVDPGLAQKVATDMKGKLSAASKEAALQAARELGRRGAGMEEALKNKDARAEANNSPQYWAKLVQERGNAAKGELIYHSARMICVQCHQIGGAGGKMGPDMSTIGASAPLDYVIESVLLPAAKVKEGYHGVSYTLNDGGSMTGVPFEENASVVRIRVPGGLEMEVPKAKIKSSEIIGSLMPAGLVDGLSEEEKINLFAFLGSVGRPGAYDASSGSVARVWRVSANAADAKTGAGSNAAPAVYSLTDGRLLPEHWALALAAAGSAQQVFATAKFQLGAAGKVDLKTVGTTEMWVDGKPVQAGAQALEAGEHILTVSVKTGDLPPVLQATATNARFVTP
jgi:putative heme-binding domain-containing protein